MRASRTTALLALAIASATAQAQTYTIDPGHTFPSFEGEHMGISLWRGRFNKTSGRIVLDRAAGTGTVDIAIDATTIDFGVAKANERLKARDAFNVEQYPQILYRGKAVEFRNGQPVAVDGEMTLIGVTRPLRLTINRFKCIEHPVLKREICGADASGEFKRSDYGLTYNSNFGDLIRLAIEVEAVKSD
ncbi:Polyisoprenoid-binding protein YceI [Noviherbaspirillum humi]|uniref:Polyisoprenoid-binding protein YceI n=1 Tax=Noviherbaspirillum humi TaxID=1688639 RepID=A0A239K7T2_9BURK|nr:YceI family protein [Noviherbaspirillum humi]SNT14427.1 Polyisoprenoid-binding protein YceI [Noviherbaspirillum humi]